jgi:hypothetical protein
MMGHEVFGNMGTLTGEAVCPWLAAGAGASSCANPRAKSAAAASKESWNMVLDLFENG